MRTLPIFLLCALLTAACGAHVRPEAGGTPAGYPVTVHNCGRDLTFDRPPERAVAYDIGIVEIMFALGLGDRMSGYVLSDAKDPAIASSPWRAAYRDVRRLGVNTISKEAVLDAKADFVFAGWNYGFREDIGLTPGTLQRLGIDSYVLTESCRNGHGDQARGVMPPLQALYTDLRNIGRIFGVEQRAERLVARYQRTVREAQAEAPRGGDRPSVFLYDSGTDKPFTAGRFAAAHEVITRGGGRDVMSDLADTWTTIGWETVVERDPDVIVVNDYGEPSAREKIRFLETYPPLSRVSAVRNKRFLVMPYVSLVESPRNPEAIRTVARFLSR